MDLGGRKTWEGMAGIRLRRGIGQNVLYEKRVKKKYLMEKETFELFNE